MSMKAPALLAGGLLALALCGCATGTGGGNSRGDRNLITEEELDQIQELSAFEALWHLRPGWMIARGAVSFQGAVGGHPSVSLDGIPRGEIDALHEVVVHDIREMRLLSAADAATRYGTGYPAGVIEIWTKGRLRGSPTLWGMG